MQNKSNAPHSKNVGAKPNNQAKNNHKNVTHNNKGHGPANKNVGHNQKNSVPKKVVPKVEVLDLNTATPEIETELPVKSEKIVPILEPDKNPTIVIPVISTEPVTSVPVTDAVIEPITEAPTQPVTEPVTVPAVDNVVSNPQPVVKKGINNIEICVFLP